MKIVVLDSYCVRPDDLDWSMLHELADQVEYYPRTRYEEIAPRIAGAEFVVTNKCRIDEAVLAQCPNLRWVGLTATGTDSLDLEACRRHGVAVANVPGYSTYSVAQHTFALLLEIANGTSRRAQSLQDGYWQTGVPDKYGIQPHIELYDQTIGLIGFGAIGQATARIAQGFGMRLLVHTRTKRENQPGLTFVSLEELLQQSDVVSLHCPATQETKGIINRETLAKMKPGAILLNTARGSLVDEDAVVEALKTGQLGWYGADVLCHEPVEESEPLRLAPHALITPHVAWATTKALERLAKEVCENLKAFQQGEMRNVVNLPLK